MFACCTDQTYIFSLFQEGVTDDNVPKNSPTHLWVVVAVLRPRWIHPLVLLVHTNVLDCYPLKRKALLIVKCTLLVAKPSANPCVADASLRQV